MDKFIDFFINIFLTYIWNSLNTLRAFFVIFCIILYILCTKKEEVYNIFFPITYNKLCLKIGTLLNKNKNLFREFGPNSSLNSEKDPIKQDINLWKIIKTNEILPNNKKIRELIEQNENIILPIDRNLFEKMKHHIMAFEAHVLDETINYRNNQFPDEFEKLIYSKCEELNTFHIKKISKWLKQRLFKKRYKNLKIKTIWLFGSILKGEYKSINDIDILIMSDIILSKDDQLEFIELINNLKREFNKYFAKKLNCIFFSKNEKKGFYNFMKKIDIKRKL